MAVRDTEEWIRMLQESLAIENARLRAGDASMDLREQILKRPSAYLFFQWLVGGSRARRLLIDHFVRPVPHMRLLDVGCGPAHVLQWLPEVDYTGTDMDAEAIEYARQTYGHRARFLRTDPAEPVPADIGSFDVIMMNGVMHHLDDVTLVATLAQLAGCLAPGGRLVTLDGCYFPDTRGLRAWLLANDRGKHVRTEAEYRALATRHFSVVETHRQRRMFRVPYDAMVMVCATG